LETSISNTPEAFTFMYTSDHCWYCEKAKDVLTAWGIKFIEININIGDNKQELRRLIPEATTTPQIFIAYLPSARLNYLSPSMILYTYSQKEDIEVIGGCDDLIALGENKFNEIFQRSVND
jgi:glutaredoxin